MTGATGPAAHVEPVRVMLVDDTPDFRFLLRAMIDGDDRFVVVGEAGDGVTAVRMASELEPDLVLLDLAVPVMDGQETLPMLRAACPQTRVVVLSGFEGSRMRAPLLAAGASAYVQKGAAVGAILTAMAQVSGRSWPTDPVDRRRHRESDVRPAPAAAGDTQASSGPGDATGVGIADEAERLRSVLATAAHELRTPAMILVGLTQVLADRGPLGSAGIDPLLDAIVRQAQILDRVTLDLLTSSQAERHDVNLELRDVALAPILHAAAVAAPGGGADVDRPAVTVDCPSDCCVRADPVRVEQMVGNLLANAAKYGAFPVCIRATRMEGPDGADTHAEVSVSDRGPGVPPEFVSRLFQQYARASGLRPAGNGIGLYVVRSLAEAQGGRAWYEPADSGGSRFVFSLPLATQSDS